MKDLEKPKDSLHIKHMRIGLVGTDVTFDGCKLDADDDNDVNASEVDDDSGLDDNDDGHDLELLLSCSGSPEL